MKQLKTLELNMAIKLIKGNLLESRCSIIAHGVNCRGGFGSGIAGQIAVQYPNVKKDYLSYHNNVGWKLGDIQLIGCNRDIGPTTNSPGYITTQVIANCATQDAYGYDGVLYANYHAIEQICKKLRHHCKEEAMTLAMPKIGCGLAGGDWGVVEEIYDNVFHDIEVKVYYL